MENADPEDSPVSTDFKNYAAFPSRSRLRWERLRWSLFRVRIVLDRARLLIARIALRELPRELSVFRI
jgi:hypothetical protein